MLKTIYVVTVSNFKLDKIEEAMFYSPLVTTNLLKAYRCVNSIIDEHKGEENFNVTYEVCPPLSLRRTLKHVNYFKMSEKTFHNLPIALWKLSGINEKTKKLLQSDYRELGITAYRIEI